MPFQLTNSGSHQPNGGLPDRRIAQLPLLITGVAGVAGYNAFRYFRNKYGDQVIGVRPVNNWPLSEAGIVGCDVEDQESLQRLFDKYSFRSVLNSGGSCALKACELDPAMAHRVNVNGIASLLQAMDREAQAAQLDRPISLVHLSIDLVFSGASGTGGYVETDPTDPVTVYGKTMVLAEELVLRERTDACILRISLPMGESFNGHAGAIDWIESRFRKNKPATLYFDEVRTPTYVECLNELIEEAFSLGLSGLFHAGGSHRWSLYQIAQIVNRVGGYDPGLLMGCPRIDAGPMPPRAGNVTMDSSKLRLRLGRDPFIRWPVEVSHWPQCPNWHFGRQPWRGQPDWIPRFLYQRQHEARAG